MDRKTTARLEGKRSKKMNIEGGCGRDERERKKGAEETQ